MVSLPPYFANKFLSMGLSKSNSSNALLAFLLASFNECVYKFVVVLILVCLILRLIDSRLGETQQFIHNLIH